MNIYMDYLLLRVILKIENGFYMEQMRFTSRRAFWPAGRRRNFTSGQMKEGIEYAHRRGKKVYVTINIIPIMMILQVWQTI